MSLNRGDVVLLNAPFVTRPGSKIRPMLVVQSDRNNTRIRNTILAAITTNVNRTGEPTQVFIDISTSAGHQTGLLANSVVSCENLLTVRQSQIIRTIGILPADLLENVNEALKVSSTSPDARVQKLLPTLTEDHTPSRYLFGAVHSARRMIAFTHLCVDLFEPAARGSGRRRSL